MNTFTPMNMSTMVQHTHILILIPIVMMAVTSTIIMKAIMVITTIHMITITGRRSYWNRISSIKITCWPNETGDFLREKA
jgi:hypothetical protein